MKNPFGKTVDKDAAYAVYTGHGAMEGWEYRVLKTYQRPDKEAGNQYARWFLATKSPFTYGNFELGDGYAHEVLREVRSPRRQFGLLRLTEATDEWREHYD